MENKVSIICSFPSCKAIYNEAWLTMNDKKYYFCSKIHKYNMVKTLKLCKLCDNYTEDKDNVCDNCVNVCTRCIVCNYKLDKLDKHTFNKNTHNCEKCISDGSTEFIICSTSCYYKHIHCMEQNRIVSGNCEYGCSCTFPRSDLYDCDVCYGCKFCSYDCLRKHYINNRAGGGIHGTRICMSRGCEVILRFLPMTYRCSIGCCSYCSKECAQKPTKSGYNCLVCYCTNYSDLCSYCTKIYCIICCKDAENKCSFNGGNCNRYLCDNERCITKHNNLHKLNDKDICSNRGCYKLAYIGYKCKCGLTYCSETCVEADQQDKCPKCACSHNTKMCYTAECNNKVCGSCSRFCNDCKRKLEQN